MSAGTRRIFMPQKRVHFLSVSVASSIINDFYFIFFTTNDLVTSYLIIYNNRQLQKIINCAKPFAVPNYN